MNTSRFFRLNWRDFAKGLAVAVFTGVMLPVLAAIQTPDFSILTVDWSVVWILALNGGIAGGAGYLIKNLFSDEEGKLGGVV